MNKQSKFSRLVITGVLLLATILPLFTLTHVKKANAAATTNTTVKVTDAYDGATYKLWKLLDATETTEAVSTGSTQMKLKYSVPGSMRNYLKDVLSITDNDNAVADQKILAKLDGFRASETATFANKIFAKISSGTPTNSVLGANGTATFSNVAPGYYLISESVTSGAGVVPSLNILKTVAPSYATDGVIPVSVKRTDTPTFEKESLSDAATPAWETASTHDVGDTISFRLKATLPANYADYQKYFLTFEDTMSKGLAYQNDAKVYLVPAEKAAALEENTLNNVAGVTVLTPDSVTPATTSDGASSTNLKVAINDIKTSASAAKASDVIVVEYTAKLTKDATKGKDGTSNAATLSFATDPNSDSGGTPGKTPTTEVKTYTFDLVVAKVDGLNKPLDGAKFTLEKKNGESWDLVAEPTAKAPQDSAVKNLFTFEGIGEGEYRLTETQAPTSYNAIEPMTFTITATIGAEGLTNITNTGQGSFTIDLAKGSLSTNIVNQRGRELPSTGGMGTVIIYTIGAILAVGMGVTLVVKRRMSTK